MENKDLQNIDESEEINGFPSVANIPEYIYEDLELPTGLKDCKNKIVDFQSIIADLHLQIKAIDSSLTTGIESDLEYLHERKTKIINYARHLNSQIRILRAWYSRELNRIIEAGKKKNKKDNEAVALDPNFSKSLEQRVKELEQQVERLKKLHEKERINRHEDHQWQKIKIAFLTRVIWELYQGHSIDYVGEIISFVDRAIKKNPDYGMQYEEGSKPNSTDEQTHS